MKEKLFGKDSVLGELLLGILAFGVIVQIVGFAFLHAGLFYTLGLWIGVVTAVGMALHMAYTIEIVVEMDEDKASGKLRSSAVIRYLIAVVVVMAVYFFKIGNPLCCIAGIMGLKIGAYLQPLTHKILRR